MAEFSAQDDEYVTSFPQFTEDGAEAKAPEETKQEVKSESKEQKAVETPVVATPKLASIAKTRPPTVTTPTKGDEVVPDDPILKLKFYARKIGCRTNPQQGTFVGGVLVITAALFLRYCSLKYFLLASLGPLCYGLFGSRTFALGELKGKVVLVTGASSGLGRGLAISSANKGAKKVILVARSTTGLNQTREQIHNLKLQDCEVVVMPCDVTSPEDVAKLATKCLKEEGNINLLINCAGSGDWKPILETTPAEAAAHMACPYLAAYNMTHAFLPSLIAGGKSGRKGHIMNVTSAAAYSGWRGSASYGSARWAVRGFSEYLRCEVKDHGIGVTLVNPGQIRGTAYATNNQIDFDNLPWLFAKGYNSPRAYDCEMVASRALRGCVDGECEVHVPGPMAHSMVWLTSFAPSFAWALIDFKPFWLKKCDDTNETKKKQ